MKTNLEISVKFWLAMAAFFCIVLSVPLSEYLVDKNILNYRELYGICLIMIVMLICVIAIISLRYSELKKTHKNSKFFSDMSFQTLEDYETQIKEQSDEIYRKNTKTEQLKTAFEDAVAEITDLRSKLEADKVIIKHLDEKITYWKERALHQKHTKKVVESEWYECVSSEYDKNIFEINNKYKIYTIISVRNSENLLALVGKNGVSYLVFKSDFKPVNP